MAIHLFGFGGVRLVCAGVDCVLPNATGTLAFEPINLINTTINYAQDYKFIGYRVRISLEAYNTCTANDYVEWAKLVAIFNAMNSDQPLTVYPYYTAGDDNLSYVVRSNSTFYPEQIARTQAGQKISLEFESIDLVTWLPSLSSSQTTRYWLTQDDKNVTTQADDKIIFTTTG